jgi:peptide/nickel transport system permease protein
MKTEEAYILAEERRSAHSPSSFFHAQFSNLRRFLAQSLLNVVGLALISLLLMLAIGGAALAPYPPTKTSLGERLRPPSAQHLMGTDNFGRDIFSRVLSGARISLQVAAIVLSISVVVGFLVGAVAGLAGGLADELLMRVTDLFIAFPALVFAAAIAATLGRSLENTMIALATVYWPWYARLIRSQVLGIAQEEYIVATRALGLPAWRVIWRHILPNVLPLILVQLSLDAGYAILSTSSLSFLGLGAQPPSPEWGAMLTAAREFIREAWWYMAFPGLALTLTVLGFNLLGDGLRDYLDPRLRRRLEKT